MADCNRKYNVSPERNVISAKLQRLPHIFGHVLLNSDTGNTARRRPTYPEIQCTSGLESAILDFGSQPTLDNVLNVTSEPWPQM
jgi:hypothetical protein